MADPKNDDFLDDLEALAAEADAQEEADEMAEPTDEIPCRRRRVAETNGLTGFISSLGLTTFCRSTTTSSAHWPPPTKSRSKSPWRCSKAWN